MNDVNLQFRLSSLSRELDKLDFLIEEDSLALRHIADYRTQLEGFLLDISTFLDGKHKQLVSRGMLQNSLGDHFIAQESLQLFCIDQINFYKEWMLSMSLYIENPNYRCHLDISSREMLLIVRLLREVGLLQDSTIKSNIYFLKTFFATNKREYFSYESLRKKYSELDKRTLKKVRQNLVSLVELIDFYLVEVDGGRR
ncbi:hypothetical protein [Sphingobacterium bambusae]|uniref:Uncharacterized protein n=1 Tax=Sphingobacterium bambusae TaxID=662858 RepID=A0ABW6BCS0_9SPHI|nr:hypothetical protein [Sphingobacterium bambusae]WPL48481.1 hypothetical protein SCB77_21260 [Sphingobacterium bambusae]